MDILMLRFDIFEQLHASLYDFWKDILNCFRGEPWDAHNFAHCYSFNEEISGRIEPDLYKLCRSYTEHGGALSDLLAAQGVISDYFGIPHHPTITKVVDEHFARVVSEEGMDLISEYYEIEESKQLLNRESKEILSLIKREMKKFWNRIDTLIINSYKQMLYDVTGSDDLVNAFMNEARTVGIMRDLSIAKRGYDYDTIYDMITALDANTGEWISDIERLVERNVT